MNAWQPILMRWAIWSIVAVVYILWAMQTFSRSTANERLTVRWRVGYGLYLAGSLGIVTATGLMFLVVRPQGDGSPLLVYLVSGVLLLLSGLLSPAVARRRREAA